MTQEERQARARKGGLALVQKRGREHMRRIGAAGFQAVLVALAGRQDIPVDYRGNPFKYLLKNLKAKKRNRR